MATSKLERESYASGIARWLRRLHVSLFGSRRMHGDRDTARDAAGLVSSDRDMQEQLAPAPADATKPVGNPRLYLRTRNRQQPVRRVRALSAPLPAGERASVVIDLDARRRLLGVRAQAVSAPWPAGPGIREHR